MRDDPRISAVFNDCWLLSFGGGGVVGWLVDWVRISGVVVREEYLLPIAVGWLLMKDLAEREGNISTLFISNLRSLGIKKSYKY